MDHTTIDSEFLRPMVHGWLGKIESSANSKSRQQWKDASDECHDDRTEVLTDDGWRLFKDLTGLEKLATVNLDTDTIEFQVPSRLVARQSSGEMIEFCNQTLSAVVTKNHRMVGYSAHSDDVITKEAASLLRSDRLKLTAANWGGVTPDLPGFLGGVSPVDFAEWLGFYIAEGCCVRQPERAGVYRVDIAQKKESGRDYYDSLADRIPFKTGAYSGKSYRIFSKDLWHFLKPLGNCYTKHVPKWVKDAPQNIIKAFLRGYLEGDGHISKDGFTASATASKRLADDLQELYLKIGRSASIREKPPGESVIVENGVERTIRNGVLYIVTAWKSRKKASLKSHRNGETRLYYRTVKYDGIVYCATVGNGTLITRRNGKPLISGNCMMFYSHSAAAMWDPTYSKRFWKGVKLPKFRVTINKAFEMVAIFSPNLIWEVPHRQVTPKRPLEFPQEMFMQNPEMAQIAQQIQMQDRLRDESIAMLMDRWLNYTPQEQPGGGLAGHSHRAVVDSLLTGRGLLAARPYKMPGSGRNLTGAFREDPHSLYLDPDFDSVDECRWMAIKHVDLYWEVEEKFKLPKGSLKGKTSLESSWAFAESSTDDGSPAHRKNGATSDLLVWYEVFSKSGAGVTGTSMDATIRDHLDKTVGQYAYIAICADCPYPLNLTTEKLRKGGSDEDVKQALSWPVPFWADDRWPVEHLDYYIDPQSAWPVSPLAPGLGELKLLNFLMSWFANRTWSSSRDFWAVAQPYLEHYKEYINNGDDQMIIPTPVGLKSPKEAIEILTQPEARHDMTQLIGFVSEMFDKRVGLTPTIYGQNEGGTQNRTAEETSAKQRAVNARPEYMQKLVVDWQSRVAAAEAFVCRWFVTSEDVAPFMGELGAMLWEQHVQSSDIEMVVRQFSYSIAAASIRRPNRDRDIGNFQQVMNQFAPVLAGYGQQSGNYEPWNGMVREWAELHDADLQSVMIPPPEQNPEAEAMQQQMLQLQMAELQGKVAKLNAEAQNTQAETQMKPMEMQMQQIQAQSQMQMEQLRQQGEAMKLQSEQAKAQMEMAKKQAEMQMKAAENQIEILRGVQVHKQEMQQDQEKHEQEMSQKEDMSQIDAAVKMRQSQVDIAAKREQSKVQVETAKQKAEVAKQTAKQAAKKPKGKSE